MALLNRFTRLLRADVHAVLDRMEEPATLLCQALREMEEEVAHAVAELKVREVQQQALRQQREDTAAKLARLAGELDLAFTAGNDALARGVLRRRLENERHALQLDQRLTTVAQDIAQRQRTLDEQNETLEALRRKAAAFDIDGIAPASACDANERVSEADIELAWLRERQQRGAP